MENQTNSICMEQWLSKIVKHVSNENSVLICTDHWQHVRYRCAGGQQIKNQRVSNTFHAMPMESIEYIISRIWFKHNVLSLFFTAFRFIIGLENTTALQSIGAKLYRVIPQKCREMDWGTDAFWECYIRHIGVARYHPTSTCRMGPAGDENAVVDPELR